MVTLINKTRKMRTFNLDHPFFRSKKWGAKRLKVVVIEEHKDGSRYPREVRRNIVGSLTLLAGEEREDLPPQIAAVPEIRKALRKGLLEIRKPGAKAGTQKVQTPKKKNGSKRNDNG